MVIVTIKHVASPSGVAECGTPAKLADIVPWGGDHNCDECAKRYALRARGKAAA